MSFTVRVDAKNPGQFFACCGLFELAHRVTGGAEARFDATHFIVDAQCTLTELLDRWTASPIEQLELDDDSASPMRIGGPFNLRMDWWKDTDSGGRELKVWAGTMQSGRIMRAMVAALRNARFHDEGLLDVGCIVYDPDEPTKKVEPFYFDARRAPNSHSRDVGFSPNDLDLTTTAFPAVEALALVGLQRCRPGLVADRRRVFEYRAWSTPLPVALAAPAVAGCINFIDSPRYRFEVWFRTGQKKHKAFRPAVLIDKGDKPDA
ncbi:MAG TPA: hypothetical protein VFG23_03465 [Polyangia bacterium]|nr:hypothetical protein [Polyangia bacterium]